MKFDFRCISKHFNAALNKVGLNRSQQKDSQSITPKETVKVLASILGPFETYVVFLQSLLIWERPRFSALAFLCVNVLFWLVVSWNRRFYSILCLIAMVVFISRTAVKHILQEIRAQQQDEDFSESWTPIHPQVLSVPELSRYLNDAWSKAKLCWSDIWQLRESNHGLFCFLMCAVFMITALLGCLIPGVLVIYSLVLIITLGPGIILHLIPASFYDHIAGFFSEETTGEEVKSVKSRSSADSDSDLEEFLPENTPETLRKLSLKQESLEPGGKSDGDEGAAAGSSAESDNLITVRELGMESFLSETEDSSLYKGLGSFPSVEEENESDIEPDDILEKQDEEDKNGIHFVLTHFKEDSSESENEAMFSEGLSFGAIAESVPKPSAKDDSTVKSGQEAGKGESSVKDADLCDIDDDVLADFEILDDDESS